MGCGTGSPDAFPWAWKASAAGDAHIVVWPAEDLEAGEPVPHSHPLIQGPRALLLSHKERMGAHDEAEAPQERTSPCFEPEFPRQFSSVYVAPEADGPWDEECTSRRSSHPPPCPPLSTPAKKKALQ